ncbi:LamG-like jellyroll fold domain-containing protein [Paenibacillus sedimenti]|uniref:Alginate lyase family protein n=1 Tax=Paenibacillus sedimenti TaxID=2770274 RepID=A0A926QJT1_9BACL|nr:LamG-like jellyroll fold domain-containing protein [Paenibacillus sedimenti]MBD0381865.1 alginate lyase family protein [Paenibacillus sedimenti]
MKRFFYKRYLSLILAAVLLVGTLPMNMAMVSASDEAGTIESYTSSIPTPQGSSVINPNYDRQWDNYEVNGSTGLAHPGILHSRTDLNTIRDMVWLGKEPWASAFEKFRKTPESAKDIVVYGFGGDQKEFSYPKISDSNGDKQLRQDATTAYQQALMWYITGDQAYLNNAKKVLDAWGNGLQQFFDTTEPANWDSEALIWGASSVLSSGVAGLKMAAAAEILLYTPSSGFCRDAEGNIDPAKKGIYDRFFRLIWQESNKWYGFFNQAAVGNMGYMAISIFLDDINGYNEAVERFAVNKKAVDSANANPTANSTNFSVSAMILDNGQVVEMGRDQPHAGGDVGALGMAAQMIYTQGTMLDPVTGVPVAAGGVDPYEFQNQKLLKMISYFSKYNLGYDVDFLPNVNGLGQKTEWATVSTAGRGAGGPIIASIYNHYKHVKGYSGSPFDELYKYPEGIMGLDYPEGQSIDMPGFGQLLFTPAHAALGDAPKGPPQPLAEKEDPNPLFNRHPAIPFDSNNKIPYKNGYVKPGIASYLDETGYIQYTAEGTMNGNWIGYENFDFGSIPVDTLAFNYGLNSGIGATVAMYVTEADVKLTDDSMALMQPTAMFQVPNTGWWATQHTHVQKLNGLGGTLTGRKNLYFKLSGSGNAYNFAPQPYWFQFSNGFAKADNLAVDAPFTSTTAYAKNTADNNITLTDGGYIGYRNMNFDSGTVQFELNHKAAGSGILEMRLGGPEGELIKSYGISDSGGVAVVTSFAHAEAEILYGSNAGNNNLYYVYKGTGSLTINSFKYVTPSVVPIVTGKTEGGAYYTDMFDNAERVGDNVVLQGDDSAVVYRAVDLGTRGNDRVFMSLKVKSDEPVDITATNVGQAVAGAPAQVAVFHVPDTQGKFVALAYDLTYTAYATRTGSMMMKLETSGGTAGGNIEVDYISFNNNDIEFLDLIHDVNIASNHSGDPLIATVGDTVTLSFTASEVLENVKVTLNNASAVVNTTDNLHYTASFMLGDFYTSGKVSFRIDYEKLGQYGQRVTNTTDGSAVTIVQEAGLLTDVFKTLSLIDSTPGRSLADTKTQAGYLLDNTNSFSDFRAANNSGSGSWVAFDLGAEQKVLLSKVKILARSDQTGRAAGVVIQGTNHIGDEPWVTLTTAGANTANWQTLSVLAAQSQKYYRYIRVYNAGNWFGNLSEVKFLGTVQQTDFVPLDSVSIQSDNPENSAVALTGNTVTLTFAASKALENVSVKLGDQTVAATTTDQRHWIAQFTVGTTYKTGNVGLLIMADNGPAVMGTTDGTSVLVIDPLQSALAAADAVIASNYTRLSYYHFKQQVDQVKAAMQTQGYSATALAKKMYDAKSLLVRNPLPLSLYSFEENAASSIGSSNGTVTGTPAYGDGKSGKAISLNGSNTYVTLPSDHPLATSDEITISTWVYWKGSTNWQRIFDFGTGTSRYMFLTPKSGSNTLRFAIKNGGSEQNIETTSLPLNEWVHVAVTLGGGTAKLYVNGVEKKTGTFTIKMSDFKPTLNYIGKAMFNDPLFNGMVDEFRIYNYALSAIEIGTVYSSTASLMDRTLLNYALNEAAALDKALYNETSWQALETAVTNAKALAADAAQDAIDAATAQLLNKLEALNSAPVFTPIPAKTVEAGTSVTFSVVAVDKDADALTYSSSNLPLGASFNTQTGQFAWTPNMPGNYGVTFAVYDARGATAAMTVDIQVVDTIAPTTIDDAPQNWVNHDVAVNLTASDSGSGVAATYYTLDGGVQQTGTTVNITEEGIHSLVYWSVDHAGNVETVHTVPIHIDKSAPTLNVVPDKTELWPPNHMLVSVTAGVYGSDNISGIDSIVLISITSNEPDQGTESEDQPNDIQNAEYGTLDQSFSLRAERSDKGTGRIYLITYTATDKAGNKTVTTVTLTVPHDRSDKK